MIEIRFANIYDIVSMNERESCSFPVAEAVSKERLFNVKDFLKILLLL